ncbi:MAG TPA: SpoIIIAH-like family protein, partial [Bacillota bacterium]
IEQIHEMLEKLNLSDEVRKQAERELWRLTQATAKENELESLLKANGFQNTLATISPNLVTLVIADKIQPHQVKLIGQMASEVTSYKIDQIQIVKRE